MKTLLAGEYLNMNLGLLLEDGVPTEFFAEPVAIPSLLNRVYRAKVDKVRSDGIVIVSLDAQQKAILETREKLKSGDSVVVTITKEFAEQKLPLAKLGVILPTETLVLLENQTILFSKRLVGQGAARMSALAAKHGIEGVIFRSGAAECSDERIWADYRQAVETRAQIYAQSKRGSGAVCLLETDFLQRTKERSGVFLAEAADFSCGKYQTILADAINPVVQLPSQGNLIFEQTAAFVSVDVNVGKSGRFGTEEDTAYYTNLEAAKEVGRQVQLRNLSGTILVDAVSMQSRAHQTEVLNAFRQAFLTDSAKTKVLSLTVSGIVEITRERRGISLTAAFAEVKNEVC